MGVLVYNKTFEEALEAVNNGYKVKHKRVGTYSIDISDMLLDVNSLGRGVCLSGWAITAIESTKKKVNLYWFLAEVENKDGEIFSYAIETLQEDPVIAFEKLNMGVIKVIHHQITEIEVTNE